MYIHKSKCIHIKTTNASNCRSLVGRLALLECVRLCEVRPSATRGAQSVNRTKKETKTFIITFRQTDRKIDRLAHKNVHLYIFIYDTQRERERQTIINITQLVSGDLFQAILLLGNFNFVLHSYNYFNRNPLVQWVMPTTVSCFMKFISFIIIFLKLVRNKKRIEQEKILITN